MTLIARCTQIQNGFDAKTQTNEYATQDKDCYDQSTVTLMSAPRRITDSEVLV